MNREEALKILGFNKDDNPSKEEIRKVYLKLVFQYHSDKHSDKSKDAQKQNEEKCKQINPAYEFLTGKNAEEVTNLTDENLDKIDSIEGLKLYLYTAISKGNTEFLKKLFSKFKSSKDGKFGDYINDNIYNCSALVLAVVTGGNIKTIKLLLENGADCNIGAALYWACGNRYDKVVELLLERGADPNTQNERSDTALFAHIMYGLPYNANSKVTELLLKHGANPNVKDRSGCTPLIMASDHGYYETVKTLLKYNADFNIQDEYGNTPLSKASSRGHYKIVELLLKHGAGKESESVNKALLAAVQFHEHGHDKEKTVELLLKYGANPNEKNYHMRLIEHAPYFANSGIINCIKTIVLPYGSNDKVKKLMAEYGGVDRCYLRDQMILTCCCLTVASATLFSMASPWRYIPTTIFALAACFFVKNAVQAAFFAKTKEPSPEFAEVITEKVANTKLNAENNSQKINSALV